MDLNAEGAWIGMLVVAVTYDLLTVHEDLEDRALGLDAHGIPIARLLMFPIVLGGGMPRISKLALVERTGELRPLAVGGADLHLQ